MRRLEALVGMRVHDVNGVYVGRIEELRAERRGHQLIVDSYLVGASAILERIGAWTLTRPIRWMFKHPFYSSYRVPWHCMDLSDRARPRLTVRTDELRRVG
jgi:sporulation protein YlmC with PRC-barrel domain